MHRGSVGAVNCGQGDHQTFGKGFGGEMAVGGCNRGTL